MNNKILARRLYALIALIGLTLFLSACSPTLDASSEAAFKESRSEIRAELSDEKKAAFDEALDKVLWDVRVEVMSSNSGGSMQTKMEDLAKSRLDGKTADEVITQADAL